MKDDDVTAHRLLQSIYRDEEVALPVRMRAAIESLPYETPKLSATAIATMDGNSFGEALDRCIERSKGPPLLNVGPVEELPASELKKPMSRLYRRY
jgi:hypothetical protein